MFAILTLVSLARRFFFVLDHLFDNLQFDSDKSRVNWLVSFSSARPVLVM